MSRLIFEYVKNSLLQDLQYATHGIDTCSATALRVSFGEDYSQRLAKNKIN